MFDLFALLFEPSTQYSCYSTFKSLIFDLCALLLEPFWLRILQFAPTVYILKLTGFFFLILHICDTFTPTAFHSQDSSLHSTFHLKSFALRNNHCLTHTLYHSTYQGCRWFNKIHSPDKMSNLRILIQTFFCAVFGNFGYIVFCVYIFNFLIFGLLCLPFLY